VKLALTTPWSNGPLEGNINRLKVIKRQMYGRAGFELLKARVLPWKRFDPVSTCTESA
jgi:transposase